MEEGYTGEQKVIIDFKHVLNRENESELLELPEKRWRAP
jgi:hypothetical protein